MTPDYRNVSGNELVAAFERFNEVRLPDFFFQGTMYKSSNLDMFVVDALNLAQKTSAIIYFDLSKLVVNDEDFSGTMYIVPADEDGRHVCEISGRVRHGGDNYEILLSIDNCYHSSKALDIPAPQPSPTEVVPNHRDEWGSKVDENSLEAISRNQLEDMVGDNVVLKVTRKQEYTDESTAMEILNGAGETTVRVRDIISFHRCRVVSADKFSVDFESEYEDTFSCWTRDANSWFAIYSNEFETIEVFTE